MILSRFSVVMLAGFVVTHAARGDLTVRFDAPMQPVSVGDVFSVDIVADIPDPIAGWGLDVSFDETILSLVGAPVIGPSFLGAFAADGDGLAALAFPSSVSGAGVLLATLSFSADAVGTTGLWLSTTPGDLSEGFALDPTGFAQVSFESATVSAVPIPSAMILAAIGLAMIPPLRNRSRQPA